jgi:hypothetical protein
MSDAEAARQALDAHKAKLATEDLRRILETDFGRRYVWHLLEEAKVFESVWDPSARIHYNAGKQDFGHMLFAEIARAKPEAYFEMMKAAQKLALQFENQMEKKP